MNGNSRAETRRRILAELDDGDACVFDIATAIGASEQWVVDLLRTMRDETHLITGTFKDGTYRRGAPPPGHTNDLGELNRRRILAAIAHEALTVLEIAERVGKSKTYTTLLLRDLRDQVTRHGSRYIACDATPAPPPAERVPLPLWAQPLCV